MFTCLVWCFEELRPLFGRLDCKIGFISLVVSILLYGCEPWTLLAETERKIQAFENKCMRKLLAISIGNKKTMSLCGKRLKVLRATRNLYSPLSKMAGFGHIKRNDSLCRTIMPGTVESVRRRGRQCKNLVGQCQTMDMYDCSRIGDGCR